MNSTETRPLPNAADKAALKVIATTVIQTCPSLQDTAHEVASNLLKKYAITGLDPDLVYFHRFDASQSSSKAFTGWEHVNATPTSSMTLTQLVIHRFRVADQDNADLLDVYGGFYTAGPSAGTFNETNEVRLHGNEVLKDFWSIDFSSLYTERLTAFWNNSGTDFRTLAKCNFLINAVQARDKRQLSDDDFRFVTNAVIGPITWPVSRQLLEAQHPCPDSVRKLDVDGYVAANILRFVAAKGRQIVYLPGEINPFQVLETATDMHYWMLQQMNKEDARRVFMAHFSLATRQEIAENITDLMNRLVGSWGTYNHLMINKENQVITGDAFTWLRDSTKATMFADAERSLTSNGDLRKKLWMGYLSAGVKVFGPMAVVGAPVALPVIGASIASLGLNIDQAVNAKNTQERKAGILGAVLSGIDLLFNLLVLKGPGSLEEVGPGVEAAEAKEMSDLIDSAQPTKTPNPTPEPPVELSNGEPDVRRDAASPVPDTFKINEVLSDETLVREPGRLQGIYRLPSNPSTAIKLGDSAYFVRFEKDINGPGTWAIVDPANPDAFTGSIPVRLGAEGKWEITPRLGLKGGMDVPPVTAEGATSETIVEEWARSSGIHLPGLDDPEMRSWALGGVDVQARFRRIWTIGGIDVRSVLEPNADSEGARSVFMSPIDEDVEVISEFDLAQEETRANLISDASAWYERHPPTPRAPVLTTVPIETQTQLLETALAEKPGLVIGESRGSIGSKQLLIEEMPKLARSGVKTLYVQELLANVNQLDLDAFARTGEMSEELESYLKRLDFRAGNDPAGKFNLLSLVKAANAERVRVQAIDMTTTYNINKDSLHPFPNNQMSRSFFASEVIRFNEELKGPGKWIALVDQQNMATFRGYRGISEQTDALCVRIDDVTPGQAQPIGSDPGLSVEYADYPDSPVEEVVGSPDLDNIQDLIRGDWRLQLETPWAYRSPQNLRALLSEQGMFTFQRYRSSLLVVYRNAENRMADSVIRMTPEGRLNLDTPLRPAYDSMTVDNLDELKKALVAKGMKAVGWPADLAEITETIEQPTSPTTPPESAGAGALIDELESTNPGIEQHPSVPDNWQANELLEGETLGAEPGKYQGIYRLHSNPSTAIMMNDMAYYVRFEADLNGPGHWAIVDPENPNSFSGSIPVRLNADGEWETMPRLGLKGGGKTPATPGTSGTRLPDPVSGALLPASEYEVPSRLRPHLEKSAAGLNDQALRDVFDSLQEYDPYRDFKAIRKRLYQDAKRFYAELQLPERPPVPSLNPQATAEETIEKILEHGRGLIIGESHDAIGSKQWLIENMELLAGKHVKTLYMEHLLTDFHQAALDSFFETGVMPKELETYLSVLDIGHMTDPLERYTFLELVKEAQKQRIRIQAIDCMASYRIDGMEITSGQRRVVDETARQKMMNYFARSIIRADQAVRGAHKWVALMGNSHSNTFEGVAGVSELEEAIGIRVEDVAEGASSGIEVDPGKILPMGGDVNDRPALVRGDLRLQMETPWTAHTMTEFEALLPHHGMYSLKQQPRMLFLVHRSRTKELVRTLIQTDRGRYYIERPNWPLVSGKRYDSIKELLQGLDSIGLSLGGWSKPL
ncbi:membrane-targeted effector domain-containing toxin [Pseudomonas sp. ANT_H12B]|uniref:membrane-targeted effector domain-containing toxin n=1 Tax=Pseudomonas sp. ANT_H12B TaxID=2597348 RepID=UPI0011EE4799|nr:membrane-targeted effector domain-containing toxin [Pseudomonas sp. ANT_H12B]KAA0971543.1 membrane-targeted effector domain-containing toxin [Pseudomonas sp. ANT_H12B]